MASRIQLIGTPATAESSSITIPSGHKAGDLLLCWAWRESTTNPTIPAGWTNLTNTKDGTTCSISIGWKFAISAADTSGTWTNATSMGAIVFRNVHATTPCIFSNNEATATTGATQTWSNVTLKGCGQWLVGFVGHRSTDTTTLTTPPTGMINSASTLGATSDVALHQSNGLVYVNYVTNNTTSGGTNSGAITAIVTINPAEMFNNLKFPSSVSTGIISITEKAR